MRLHRKCRVHAVPHFRDQTYECGVCKDRLRYGDRYVRRDVPIEGDYARLRLHVECDRLTFRWDEDQWYELFQRGPEMVGLYLQFQGL